jgi:hypothetical protein
MPSDAYGEFLDNLTDVHRLVALHRSLSGSGRGRRGLGHLTRGGLLLLCAAWERYVETVVLESGHFLTTMLPGFAALPAAVHQRVTQYANGSNTWTVADLATPAWTVVYLDAITDRTSHLHTPKHGKLKALYTNHLGVLDIGQSWGAGTNTIDAFVALRGEVAHRGGQSQYIRFSKLLNAGETIKRTVRDMDNFLSDHTRSLVVPPRRPWRRIR